MATPPAATIDLEGLGLEAFRDQPVAVLGLARSGVALTRFLADHGARVTVYDARTADQLSDALEAAEADARKSVELDPGDAAAQFQLGNTALAAGHLDLAFKSYIEAGSLAPEEPRIFNNLGVLYLRWERPTDAYRSFQAALGSYQVGKVAFVSLLEALIATFKAEMDYYRVSSEYLRTLAWLEAESTLPLTGRPVVIDKGNHADDNEKN